MPDQDITKQRSLQNWQVIAIISVTISATAFVTGVTYSIDQNSKDIVYEHNRVDRKDKKLQSQIDELKTEIKQLKEEK